MVCKDEDEYNRWKNHSGVKELDNLSVKGGLVFTACSPVESDSIIWAVWYQIDYNEDDTPTDPFEKAATLIKALESHYAGTRPSARRVYGVHLGEDRTTAEDSKKLRSKLGSQEIEPFLYTLGNTANPDPVSQCVQNAHKEIINESRSEAKIAVLGKLIEQVINTRMDSSLAILEIWRNTLNLLRDQDMDTDDKIMKECLEGCRAFLKIDNCENLLETLIGTIDAEIEKQKRD